MTHIDRLMAMARTLRILPEPNYQSIGQELQSLAKTIQDDIDNTEEEYEQKMKSMYYETIDKIARNDESNLEVQIDEYVYTISVTKVHKSLKNKTP